MIRTFSRLLLCLIINSIAFIFINGILPFSQGLMEVSSSIDPMSIMIFIPMRSAWLCFTMYFIIKNTSLSGKKLFLNLIFIMFFITSFTQQIDTLFIGSAFPAMTRFDIILTILSGLFALLVTAPLLVFFFQNKNNTTEKFKFNTKSLILKLGAAGIIYLLFYMFFGTFIIIRIEEFRHFYSTIEVNPIMLVIFQLLRGVLLGIFILPLRYMVKTKRIFIISICLVYLCMAVDLLLPNGLLPTNIRIAHLIEMSISMILYGVIVGNIVWGRQKQVNRCPSTI